MGENRSMSAGRITLLRILGYVAAGAVLAAGASVGGTVGTALLVLGLVLVAGLLLTFRLR
jgi:hypothetical protein